MRINLSAVLPENQRRTEEYLSSLERPMFTVDNDLFIAEMNRTAEEAFPFLSPGTRLYDVFGINARRVIELLPGQIIGIQLRLLDASYPVTVIGGERKIVLFDSVEARFGKHVFGVYGKMSGYDLTLEYPKFIPDNEPTAQTKSFLGENADFLLRAFNSRGSRALCPFNAGAVFSAVIAETGEECFFNVSKCADVSALGSERDLAIIAAYMLSLFKRHSADSKPKIKIETDNSTVKLCVEGLFDVPEEMASLIFSTRPIKQKLCDDLEEERFWFYLALLLAESNLWELEASIQNGVLLFSLLMPAAEQSAYCLLRDKVLEYARKAVALFGANN